MCRLQAAADVVVDERRLRILAAIVSRMRSRNVHEKQMMELERGPEINGPTGVICGRLLQASMLCSC